jgi:hypothetical protein
VQDRPHPVTFRDPTLNRVLTLYLAASADSVAAFARADFKWAISHLLFAVAMLGLHQRAVSWLQASEKTDDAAFSSAVFTAIDWYFQKLYASTLAL